MSENTTPEQSQSAAAGDPVAAERQLLIDAEQQGSGAKYKAYIRLSGPGWLQSAITLGGGSLASSLYLGVLAGVGMLWLQPLAMICGVIMLSAIGYVTLSTGKRPFRAIRDHVNPVLAWAWAIATLMANLVWALPQFSLGEAAMTQNLLGAEPGAGENWFVIIGIFLVSGGVVLLYDTGAKGIKIFEIVLKILVGIVVVSFFGVAVRLAGTINWGEVFFGFIPNPGLLFSPAASFDDMLGAISDDAAREFWSAYIVNNQRDVVYAAFATAVGINMTFLLPYSMLKKGWDKHFRGLAIFDLATGLFIPFVLATTCVVIAASAAFHTNVPDMPLEELREFNKSALEARVAKVGGTVEDLSEAEVQLAATLKKRDAFSLADALKPLTGDFFAQKIFGIGVVGMAISTTIILMLINGFTFCEMSGLEMKGWPYRIGCLMPGITGMMYPIFWHGESRFWLAVPTSNIGLVLLPIAYTAFFMMMNNTKLLGKYAPTGTRKIVWNMLMAFALALAWFACLTRVATALMSHIWITLLVLLVAAVLIVQFTWTPKPIVHEEETE